MRRVEVRPLKLREDPVVCSLAKLSGRFARDFASILFIRRSLEQLYRSEAVLGAFARESLVGFCCCKHLVRKPHSSIYYMGVHPEFRQLGAGKALVQSALRASPWHRLELVCEEDNTEGMAFYKALGFRCIEKITVGKYGRRAQRLRLEKGHS